MRFRYLLKQLLSLRNASQSKKVYGIVRYSNDVWTFLKYFYEKGFIAGYVKEGKSIKVYLKYFDMSGVLDQMVLNFDFKRRVYIKFNQLCKIYYDARANYVIFFSTPAGILTLQDIVVGRLCVGGLYLFAIKYT